MSTDMEESPIHYEDLAEIEAEFEEVDLEMSECSQILCST